MDIAWFTLGFIVGLLAGLAPTIAVVVVLTWRLRKAGLSAKTLKEVVVKPERFYDILREREKRREE